MLTGLPRTDCVTKGWLGYQGLTGLPRTDWVAKDWLGCQGLTGLPRTDWVSRQASFVDTEPGRGLGARLQLHRCLVFICRHQAASYHCVLRIVETDNYNKHLTCFVFHLDFTVILLQKNGGSQLQQSSLLIPELPSLLMISSRCDVQPAVSHYKKSLT